MPYPRLSDRRRREYDYGYYPEEWEYEETSMVSMMRLQYRTTIFIAILTFLLGALLAYFFLNRSDNVKATPAPTPAATPETPLFNKEPL